jgi:hypothetical protein
VRLFMQVRTRHFLAHPMQVQSYTTPMTCHKSGVIFRAGRVGLR